MLSSTVEDMRSFPGLLLVGFGRAASAKGVGRLASWQSVGGFAVSLSAVQLNCVPGHQWILA